MQAAWVLFTYESMEGKAVASSMTHEIVYHMYRQLGLEELEDRPSDYDFNEEVRFNWDTIVVIVWGCYIRDRYEHLNRLLASKRRPDTLCYSVDSLAGGWSPRIQRPRIELLQAESNGKPPTMVTDMWFPYPVLKVPIPSIQREFMIAMVHLADITQTVLKFVLPSLSEGNEERKLKDAMEIYETIQAWQEDLPERLQPEFGDVAHVYLLQ